MLLKAKPAVGQTWLWTCKMDDTIQIFLITQIKGDTCKGIILYDDAYNTSVGGIAEIYSGNFTSGPEYGNWILVT